MDGHFAQGHLLGVFLQIEACYVNSLLTSDNLLISQSYFFKIYFKNNEHGS